MKLESIYYVTDEKVMSEGKTLEEAVQNYLDEEYFNTFDQKKYD